MGIRGGDGHAPGDPRLRQRLGSHREGGGSGVVMVVVVPLSFAPRLVDVVDGGGLLMDVGGSAGVVGWPVVVGVASFP